MADETFYNPGDKSYDLLAAETLLDKFPELDKSGHYDFNNFLAQHPELQGQTDKYNVLGGMDVARRIQPGEKKLGYDWSDPYSLSGLGGLYSLYDSHTMGSDQTYKEGFADWFRNMKGIGIQRDVNPLGLLYDDDEADYYKGYYNKIHKDYQKMQADRWQEEKWRRLNSNEIFPGDGGRVPPVKLPPMLPSGGETWSPGVGRRDPSQGNTVTGHGKSGMGRDPRDRMEYGGLTTMFARR